MTARRRFLAKASGMMAAVAAAAIAHAPRVIAQPKVQWRLSTAWPPQLDLMQGSAQRLAQVVEEMSGGRFRIEVFPGGQIMAPFACFEATSKGTIEAFMGTASYWAPDREPAMQWFMSVPFGMDPQGMAAWYYQGDGLRLWEETYAPFNVVPRMGPGFAPQMGGWFRKRINTIGDYKGLKMRIAGLGGQVVAAAGGTAVVTPAADIYAAFERGVIDACEWVGPYDDLKLGLQNTARHYYYPGWHEPGTVSDFGFNRKAYEALPADLKRILDLAVAATQVHGLTEYHTKNAIALDRLKTEFKGKVELVQFPTPVLRVSGRSRPRSSGRTPRRVPWPARFMRRSRGSKRRWGPGTTSPKAPTTSSSRCEISGYAEPLGPGRGGRPPSIRRIMRRAA